MTEKDELVNEVTEEMNEEVVETPVEEITSDDSERNNGNPFLNYFRLLFRDIRVHFKEKPGTIFGLLVLIPGILIGFTINTFISAAHGMNNNVSQLAKMGGLLVFIVEVSGVLNIVNGFGIMTSRRLKSSILAAIVAVITCVCGALWYIITSKYMIPRSKYIPAANMSQIIIIICMATSVIGAVGSFFFYDKNFKKDNR